MHPYNLIHQNFATVNTLPLIDSWLVLVSCSIDELGQTRLEEAIKSEKQRLVNYSIRDKLWMAFQSASRWHSRGGRQTCLKQATRHGRTTSVCVDQKPNRPTLDWRAKVMEDESNKRWKSTAAAETWAGSYSQREGASVCTALFKDSA